MNNKQFLVAALGVGVLLRLVLMPFFAHVDLFSEARRVFYVIENDHLFDNTHRFVIFYIEVLFAAFSTFFIDITEHLFHIPDPTQSVSTEIDYQFFLNDPNIYRHLFFFKLPYLVFDIATAFLIWKFIDKPEHRRIAILLWLFNPLTIFSTYIFGRFEVISLFFLVACALQLKYDRVFFASVLFAIALHCREINLLYTPFLLLAFIDVRDHWAKNLVTLISSITTISVFYLLPDWLVGIAGGNTQLFVDPSINNAGETLNKLLPLGYYWFYPVVIGLASLAIYQWEIASKPKAERFIISGSVVLFIYFAFNVHSVHYAAWLVALPILSMQYGKKVVLPFLALYGIWLILWLLKTDMGVFTLFLAAPLSADFIGTGHFPSFFEQHIATDSFTLHQAIQLMRSLFLVVMGFFAYRVLKKEITS